MNDKSDEVTMLDFVMSILFLAIWPLLYVIALN